MKLELPNITLLAVATQNVQQSGTALVYSSAGVEFNSVKLISPFRPEGLPVYIQWDHVDAFPSIDNWNRYIVYDLWRHFDTKLCMLIHSDGYVVHPESWQPEFLQYDYIGAPWSLQSCDAIRGPRIHTHEINRVGNSVGIRSHKLCKLPTDINMPWIPYNGDYNEDTQLTNHNKKLLESYGITYAPFELALKFGREEELPEHAGIKPFCFHKWSGANHIYPKFN